MLKFFLSVFLYFGLSFFFFSCGNNTSKKQQEQKDTALKETNDFTLTEMQYKNANITLGKIQKKNITELLDVNGKIDVAPQNIISISVPMGGYLKHSDLLPGTVVKKGQTVAIIEDQQYIQLQHDFLVAKNKVFLLEREFERQKILNENKANSDKVFQTAQSDFFNQKVLVKSLAERLRLIYINPDSLNENNISKSIKIPSPISGFVSKINVNIGKYINPTDVVFEIINLGDIHLNLKIFEKDISKLQLGQMLYAYSNSSPTDKYLCKIILISRNINENGGVDVHCHFDNYQKHLIPGLYMNAKIEIKNNIVNALPESAIVRFENKHYVFIDKGNLNMQMKEVTIGLTQNDFTEVGIEPDLLNENFVIKGAYTLLMKMKNKAE